MSRCFSEHFRWVDAIFNEWVVVRIAYFYGVLVGVGSLGVVVLVVGAGSVAGCGTVRPLALAGVVVVLAGVVDCSGDINSNSLVFAVNNESFIVLYIDFITKDILAHGFVTSMLKKLDCCGDIFFVAASMIFFVALGDILIIAFSSAVLTSALLPIVENFRKNVAKLINFS
nr:hypothetical protein [Gammaproteobacteria bacterium]